MSNFWLGPVADSSTFAPLYSGDNADLYNSGVNNLGDSIDNIFTGNADWNRQVQTMRYNSAEAQKSRDWQERLSNTAYQRAVSDLRSAGLNPYLAMTGGASPSSTPSGATANTGSNVAKSSDGLLKLISTLTTLVGTAVNVSSMNSRSLSHIASRESMNNARIASREKIADTRNYIRHNYSKKTFDNIWSTDDNM